MSQQRQFEGPDVRVLLDEIRDTYGSEPKIARAETFRTGGLLGFFQREHYRLVVDETAPGPPGQRRPAARRVVAKAPAAPRSSVASTRLPAAHATPPRERLGSDLFADVADSATDTYVSRPADTAPTIEIPVRKPPAPPAPTDAAAARSFESVLRGVATLVDAPGPATTSGGHVSMEAVMARTGSDTTSANPEVAAGRPADKFAPANGNRAVPGNRADEVAGETRAAQPLEARPGEQVDEAQAVRRVALLRAGLDSEAAHWVEEDMAETGGLHAALVSVLSSLPQAPPLPRRPGSLIAVVGPGRKTAAEAARVAGAVGADPAGVAFAYEWRPDQPDLPEELVVHSAEDAMELARGHRRGRVGVVAVEAPLGGTTAGWARHVIDALRPNLVIGVVDALHKTDDMDAWIESVGGVDSLVVHNLSVTTSPAQVLRLDTPICRMGNQPATAARWAALILDRMERAADEVGAPDPALEGVGA